MKVLLVLTTACSAVSGTVLLLAAGVCHFGREAELREPANARLRTRSPEGRGEGGAAPHVRLATSAVGDAVCPGALKQSA